ncbi:hypothetical protein NBRC116494_08890 [Aurantivibrio plasticivorans]
MQEPTNSTTQFRTMTAIKLAGAITLALTMLLVSASAIGRHFGLPLPGTVEIVEALILVTAAAGILSTTIERAHASAKLITELLPPSTRRFVEVLGLILGIIFCAGLVIGNTWLIYDVWGLQEASHLLGIPIVPLRILFVAALTCTGFMLALHLFKPVPSNDSDDSETRIP